jgi:hypothetical protein
MQTNFLREYKMAVWYEDQKNRHEIVTVYCPHFSTWLTKGSESTYITNVAHEAIGPLKWCLLTNSLCSAWHRACSAWSSLTVQIVSVPCLAWSSLTDQIVSVPCSAWSSLTVQIVSVPCSAWSSLTVQLDSVPCSDWSSLTVQLVSQNMLAWLSSPF